MRKDEGRNKREVKLWLPVDVQVEATIKWFSLQRETQERAGKEMGESHQHLGGVDRPGIN